MLFSFKTIFHCLGRVCDGKVSADRTFYNYSPRPKFILTPNPLQASINIDNKYQAIQSFGQPKKL